MNKNFKDHSIKEGNYKLPNNKIITIYKDKDSDIRFDDLGIPVTSEELNNYELVQESLQEDKNIKNKYQELKNKQEKEFRSIPKFFAFSDDQYAEGLKKLNATEDEIVSIGFGGFMKKSDAKKLKELADKHTNEINQAIEMDKTGEGFIKDMFEYELANHEYEYTNDLSDTLEAIGLTENDLNKENIKHGLELATKHSDIKLNENKADDNII